MKTGAAAGMDTAGVLWGFRTRRELEDNHAKYILEKPKEILPVAVGSMR
jgi:phosphoglycolate phosphatase